MAPRIAKSQCLAPRIVRSESPNRSAWHRDVVKQSRVLRPKRRPRTTWVGDEDQLVANTRILPLPVEESLHEPEWLVCFIRSRERFGATLDRFFNRKPLPFAH